MRRSRITTQPQVRQMRLIEDIPCERALELAGWLKREISILRVRVNAQRAVIREVEDALHDVQDILAQARQLELFKDA